MTPEIIGCSSQVGWPGATAACVFFLSLLGVAVPLPDGFAGELQTKDFNCEMVTHLITADGELHLERIDRTEVVPKHERWRQLSITQESRPELTQVTCGRYAQEECC